MGWAGQSIAVERPDKFTGRFSGRNQYPDKLRLMTLRFSQFPAVRGLLVGACGIAMLAQPVPTHAQATRPELSGAPTVPVAITPNATVVEDVIARVNDQIISRSDLERAQQQLDQDGRQQGASPTDMEQRQKNLLRDLIDQQLLLSKGKELGITGDTELVRELDDIRKRNKFDTMEDLEKAAAQQGVSFEDFKANIRNSIITQQVVRDEVARRLQLSQADLGKFYEAHKAEFQQAESVHLGEILIPTPAASGALPDDATINKALAAANEVEAKLKAGAKFDDMAKQYSGGPTAQQGGDLGVFKRGALAKELEDKTFSLPPGGFTEPIRTRQGYVILKVSEHTAAGIPPLKDVQQQVEEAVYAQQMQPALRAYLTHLREDAYIDIMPGYVDSGASSKQSKPVFSAYVPPGPKKKKVVQKQRFDRRGHTSTASAPAASAPASAASATAASASGAASAVMPDPTLAGTPTAGAPAVATVARSKHPAKQKKVKREKVRFGQAPREALPSAPGTETASAGNATSAANLGTNTLSADATDTAVPASPLEDPNADPLAPKVEKGKKSRYSDRAKLPKPAKAAKKGVDPLAPPPATVQEDQTLKAQSAPLGLAGDTAAKPKKHKRQKGEKKKRMQGQPTPVKPPLVDNAPETSSAAAPAAGATPASNPSNGSLHGTPATQPATTPVPPQN